MTQADFLEVFKTKLINYARIVDAKNTDYSEGSDPFANFRLIEELSEGLIDTRAGILTRMSDKVKRIGNLLFRPAKVNDESLLDSCHDLAIYSTVFAIYVQQETDPSKIQAAYKKLFKLFHILVSKY